jgi:hypothetical protein
LPHHKCHPSTGCHWLIQLFFLPAFGEETALSAANWQQFAPSPERVKRNSCRHIFLCSLVGSLRYDTRTVDLCKGFLTRALENKFTNRVNSSCIIPLIVYYAFTPQNVVGNTRKALSSEEAVTRQWRRRHGRSLESPSKGIKENLNQLAKEMTC